MSDKYNGWTNYETWAWNLWIDNDQGTQEFWRERAREAVESASADRLFTREQNASFQLAHILEQSAHDERPEPLEGPYADLLTAALDLVNWREIALSLIEGLE